MFRSGLALIFVIILVLVYEQTSPALSEENTDPWRDIPIGTKVYAEVVTPPDAIFRQIVPDSPAQQWLRETNTLLFGEAINVSERHRFLDKEHVVRVTVQEGGWGLIEPDGQHSPYIPDPLDYHNVFVELKYLTPLPADAFTPFSVYEDTQAADKVAIIIRDAHPRLLLFEGEHLVMHVPVVLGPTKQGDYRVYRTRVTDDMPGIPAVPFSNYFSGGYTIHGAPWWNWHETVRGHYGSHGCVNLPDDEWYQLQLGGEYVNVANWVYRWMSTNIDYDETDPDVQQARVDSTDPGWYQATDTVRVIITDTLEGLRDFPLPERLGPLASASKITSWDPLIDATLSLNNQWMIMHESNGQFDAQYLPSNQSIAQIDGTTESDQWILLDCSDGSIRSNPAYEGSSRTIGQVCDHLRVERINSICTPERIDVAYFGERVLCNAERFNMLYIRERGELIEHEKVHMIQFKGYFKDLMLAGVAIDDLSPFAVDNLQLSTIGVTELMAQRRNQGSLYAEDYVFVLNKVDDSGNLRMFNARATTDEAWNYLRRACGDSELNDDHVGRLLEDALMGDSDAYKQLETQCILPPHRLVPDRWRLPIEESES